MIFCLDNGGGPVSETKIEFDGDWAFTRVGSLWELALKSSGSLRFLTAPGLCEIWILDSGESGGGGSIDGGYVYSGKGGAGGRHKLHETQLRRGVSYTVTIGTQGGATSLDAEGIESLTSAGGERSSGGTRAQMAQNIESVGTVNTGGDDGVYAYESETDATLLDELQGLLLGPGGGAGHANNNKYVYTDIHGGDPSGGNDGGGAGGNRSHHGGADGTGYGSGGGGGYGDGSNGAHGLGGAGGPGLMLIRSKQEARS